ncbi:acetolactate synthase small subunit [Pseudodesulfovibrio sediminis]|uniref:Acetolactate synthase small subunit n=1 Tax=Pseudodesulfovibrio sediminis TaxID=2810563 RepID=A0ABN6ELV1_9BACT|nr:acetolactate synthase small subunit [Pseudodesulfovibrio sediminis]BCS87015.1 acetolactate synthase small subunit [Pseudodesulfovibrio sediminis]
MTKHTLSVTVENEPGVLSRVVGLFSGRGFNIFSLNVAPTLEKDVSLMTIVAEGDDNIVEQIVKQLRKLVPTIKVKDLTELKSVDREMVLLKVNAEDSKRAEILRIVDIFRCKVVDVSVDEVTIEVTGDQGKIGALVNLLTRFGIKEIARTGNVAMQRSMQLDL